MTDRSNHHIDFKKARLALDSTGSLLDLAVKLNVAEMKTLRKTNLEPLKWTQKSQFLSVIGHDGFHFSSRNRKRKTAAEESESRDFIEAKRFCVETSNIDNENCPIVEDQLPNDSKVNDLKIGDVNETLFSSVDILENSRTLKNSPASIKLVEKLLENFRKWAKPESAGNVRISELIGKLPPELSLWSLMTCTKNLGDETLRAIDDQTASCFAKAKSNYASWKMSQKDLNSIEQMAIERIIRSKSSDLECRLVTVLRKMNRQINLTSDEISGNSGKHQKMKAVMVSQSSDMMSNGVIRRKFQCEHCAYQTDNRSHLLRHQSSIHNMFKPYHCYICTKEFTRVEYIKQHLLTAHPGVKYDATRAKNEVAFRDPVQRTVQDTKKVETVADLIHRLNQSGQEASGSMLNGSTVQEFIDSRPNGTRPESSDVLTDDIKNLLCSHCDFETRDPNGFQQHLRRCKPVQGQFRCRVCLETFLSRNYLQVHYANIHFTILYCCHSCSFYTTSLHTYDWHVAQKHSMWKDQNSCPICRKCFVSQKELVQHIEVVHLKQKNVTASVDEGRDLVNPNTNSSCHQNNIPSFTHENHWKNGLNKHRL